jgi:hypothetical protein
MSCGGQSSRTPFISTSTRCEGSSAGSMSSVTLIACTPWKVSSAMGETTSQRVYWKGRSGGGRGATSGGSSGSGPEPDGLGASPMTTRSAPGRGWSE